MYARNMRMGAYDVGATWVRRGCVRHEYDVGE